MTDLHHEATLAACIGLDWADDHHDVSLRAAGSGTVERLRLAHTPESIRDWVAELRRRFRARPVGICLELSRGPLIHALLEYEFLVLFPVNPLSVKRFREAFAPSGARDDPTEAGRAGKEPGRDDQGRCVAGVDMGHAWPHRWAAPWHHGPLQGSARPPPRTQQRPANHAGPRGALISDRRLDNDPGGATPQARARTR